MATPPVEDVTLEEDSATFLARLKEDCPDILSVLTKKQIKLINQPPNEGYGKEKVDHEYLVEAGAQCRARSMWKISKDNLSKYLLEPKGSSKSLNPQDLITFEKRSLALEKVMKRIELVIESRLKITEETLGECYLPRIVRLSRQFKFSENESKLALYALICQGGFDDAPKQGYGPYGIGGIECVIACRHLDMPVTEALAFLSKERLHMEQGLFPDVQDNYLLNSILAYDGDFCSALVGSKLTSNEFLKLEQTEMAKVILEEPGSEYLKIKSGDKEEHSEEKKGELPTGDAEEPPPGIPGEVD